MVYMFTWNAVTHQSKYNKQSVGKENRSESTQCDLYYENITWYILKQPSPVSIWFSCGVDYGVTWV